MSQSKMIIIIAALTKKRVIGRNNKLPWNIPEEFQHFKKIISSKPVVMGRKTYESIGRLVKGCPNIIISRTISEIHGADVCNTIEKGIEKAKKYGDEIFILGGAEIYKESLSLTDKMYLSTIKEEYEGDAFFPEFDESKWAVEKREDHKDFEFVVYRKK